MECPFHVSGIKHTQVPGMDERKLWLWRKKAVHFMAFRALHGTVDSKTVVVVSTSMLRRCQAALVQTMTWEAAGGQCGA